MIYLITNMINGKSYVGQTIQKLNKRLNKHKHDKNSLINKAIQKYGWENFSHIVLEENIPKEMLDEREIFWIATLKTKVPNGYNVADGGGGNSGHVLTEEEIARLSEINKGNQHRLGKHHSEETKAKIGAANRGRTWSKEMRQKLSELKTGKTISAETRAKMSEAQKGRKHTDEAKAKVSAAQRGKPKSKEHREKISVTNKRKGIKPPSFKGKHHTEESKAKMSASHKARNKKLKEENF